MSQQNLFIGSLAYATTDDTLKAHFETIGEVTSARVVTDRDSGRSKGFGFVEMADDSAADAAIEKGNGVELNGRAINVSEARPQAPREGGPRRGGGFGGGGPRRGGGGGGGFGGPRGPRN